MTIYPLYNWKLTSWPEFSPDLVYSIYDILSVHNGHFTAHKISPTSQHNIPQYECVNYYNAVLSEFTVKMWARAVWIEGGEEICVSCWVYEDHLHIPAEKESIAMRLQTEPQKGWLHFYLVKSN